jgi:pimeloyl-ACP methyl ester carboxylesterase
VRIPFDARIAIFRVIGVEQDPVNETRYARTGDLSIAWQCLGDGPVDLLIVPGFISHVEAFHELPGYTRFLSRLGAFARVITFDKRGSGLSDRVADAPGLPERIEDMQAVLDAAGSQRAVLLGISEGGALAIHFAASHPERVAALALFGAFPRLLAAPDYAPGRLPDVDAQLAAELGDAWGTGTPFLTRFGPSLALAHARIREVAARCERLSASPTAMRRLWRMSATIDVRGDVPQVRAPTLVMYRAGDRVVPVAASRWIAAHLPGAHTLELPGDDHLPFIGQTDAVTGAISALLGASSAHDAVPADAIAEELAGAPALLPEDPPTVYVRSPGSKRPRSERPEAPFQMGRFRIERTLDSGGMGAVFLADDHELGRKVAIKILHRSDADAYRRFQREATVVAQLSHPAVVQVYELGLDASVPYLVMEFVPGGTVAELGTTPLPWRRATRLIASAARGLGAAHAVGIVHRDLKPANLLLPDRAGDLAKVADFGVAKLAGAEALTHDGAVVGTLGYLAPEQARGEPVDARADVWALGATWFRLLTGRRPFEGTATEILAATQMLPISDPRAYAPDVPAEVAALVLRMCAFDREARPGDGQAAADALEALLEAHSEALLCEAPPPPRSAAPSGARPSHPLARHSPERILCMAAARLHGGRPPAVTGRAHAALGVP